MKKHDVWLPSNANVFIRLMSLLSFDWKRLICWHDFRTVTEQEEYVCRKCGYDHVTILAEY